MPPGDYAVGRGLFYSEIFLLGNGDESDVLTLPPRYRTHEEEVNAIYKLGGVRDAGMVKGMKALWTWLKELFGLRARAYQGAELGQPVLPLS